MFFFHQVAEAWKREVQNWLTSQSIELPHHLGNILSTFEISLEEDLFLIYFIENFQPSNGADSHDYQQVFIAPFFENHKISKSKVQIQPS